MLSIFVFRACVCQIGLNVLASDYPDSTILVPIAVANPISMATMVVPVVPVMLVFAVAIAVMIPINVNSEILGVNAEW